MRENVLDAMWVKIKNAIKPQWKAAFVSSFIVGILAYGYMMANHFLTYDSMWNQVSEQNMITSGRQFLTYACGFSSYYDLPWVNGFIAILFLAFSDIGAAGFAGLNFGKTLLIIGSGVITAAPIILFNTCVTKLNLVIMSFAQYLSPTFGLICGFILKDELTTEKLISYCFIWTGLIIFLTAQTITAKREEKKALLEKE